MGPFLLLGLCLDNRSNPDRDDVPAPIASVSDLACAGVAGVSGAAPAPASATAASAAAAAEAATAAAATAPASAHTAASAAPNAASTASAATIPIADVVVAAATAGVILGHDRLSWSGAFKLAATVRGGVVLLRGCAVHVSHHFHGACGVNVLLGGGRAVILIKLAVMGALNLDRHLKQDQELSAIGFVLFRAVRAGRAQGVGQEVLQHPTDGVVRVHDEVIWRQEVGAGRLADDGRKLLDEDASSRGVLSVQDVLGLSWPNRDGQQLGAYFQESEEIAAQWHCRKTSSIEDTDR